MISNRILAAVGVGLTIVGFLAASLIPPMAAHAGVDPTPALTAGGNTLIDTLSGDGPWWVGVAVLHVALRMFVDRQHWIQQGRLLSGLTAVAGTLTALVAWHFQGAPSAGILTAVIAGGTLLMHPVAQPVPVKTGGAS